MTEAAGCSTSSTPPSAVGSAYARRAAEYAEQLGSMAAVHPADEHLVTTWAEGLDGPLLDAGCGPGHWTAHLAGRGVDVRGLDQVPAFVEHARAAHPGCGSTSATSTPSPTRLTGWPGCSPGTR